MLSQLRTPNREQLPPRQALGWSGPCPRLASPILKPRQRQQSTRAVSWQNFFGKQRLGPKVNSEIPISDKQAAVDVNPPAPSAVRQGVISPRNPWYRAWRGLLTVAAAVTGFLVPWELGFGSPEALYDLHHGTTLLDTTLVALFMVDIVVSHQVAYEQDELLVDCPRMIATNYRQQQLLLDVVSGAPWDWAALAGVLLLGHETWPAATGLAVWFKALHLLRLYRVRWFFRYLEYDLSQSLLTVTLARNLVIVLYLTHWVACGFEGGARLAGYDPDFLVGLNPSLFRGADVPEQYLYSLYWAVTTLAGNEWNGMDSVSDMRQVAANTSRASVFLLFNIALGAYILGTITLLVVKNDERTGRYRDLSANLRQYSTTNQLPPELKEEMQEHLRLNFNHQDASDEQVLSIYPSTIRRRILRHLYMRHLRNSYLFKGTPRKFLDAVLAACRLEMFKGGVDILSAGDAVNELFLVVAGHVELRSPLDVTQSSLEHHYDWGGEQDQDLLQLGGLGLPANPGATSSSVGGLASVDPFDSLTSMLGSVDQDCQLRGAGAGAGPSGMLPMYVGPRKVRGPGQTFGAISFFTEIPQMETVRSLTTVRVMVLSRGAWESIERHFPIASRLVLENLKRRAEVAVANEFPGVTPGSPAFQELLRSCPSSMMYSWASPELVELLGTNNNNTGDKTNSLTSLGGVPGTNRSTPTPTTTTTSSSGSNGTTNPTSSSSSANTTTTSSNASTTPTTPTSGTSSTSSSDLWLDPTRITVDEPDYSVGNPVTNGLAARAAQSSRRMQDLALRTRDRGKGQPAPGSTAAAAGGGGGGGGWFVGNGTPSAPEESPQKFLTSFTAGQELVLSNLVRVLNVISTHVAKQDEDRTNEFLYAATRGDTSRLRALLQQGFHPDNADYDGRTALMLAAAKGHLEVVDLLLAAGANPHARDKLGRSSLLEACYAGHDTIITLLTSYGARVGLNNDLKPLEVASLLCSCVYLCDLPLLRRLIRSGADINAGDYDKRTALHISAAEGSSIMVRVLVEEGGANIFVKDRWGYTPLDEARRVGAKVVVEYLQALVERQQEAASWRVLRRQRANSGIAAAVADEEEGNSSDSKGRGGAGAGAGAGSMGPSGSSSHVEDGAAADASSMGGGSSSSHGGGGGWWDGSDSGSLTSSSIGGNGSSSSSSSSRGGRVSISQSADSCAAGNNISTTTSSISSNTTNPTNNNISSGTSNGGGDPSSGGGGSSRSSPPAGVAAAVAVTRGASYPK